jgi:hypothetical protein
LSRKEPAKKSVSLVGKLFGEKEPVLLNQNGKPISDKDISQLYDMGFSMEVTLINSILC